MNRHRQLQETFTENCRMIAACKGRVEWVIVNIRRSGKDDDAWTASDRLIREDGKELIRKGWLVYRTATMSAYHQSICKNLAARPATGDFLINLDIDNRISIRDTVRLLSTPDLKNVLYHGWDGAWGTGTSGMIGVHRDIFAQIGGYNEELLPYGYDEYDLMNRALASSPSMQVIRFCSRQAAVPNTAAERSQHLDTAYSLHECNLANREVSKTNVTAGRLVCVPRLSAAITLS